MDDYKSFIQEMQKKAEAEAKENIEKTNQTFELYLEQIKQNLSYNKCEQQFALYAVLNNMRPIYLAPIYHSYIGDLTINSRLSPFELINQINFETTFHSIRVLIERIPILLSRVYSEIKEKEGFGFYNIKVPEGKGLIRIALQKQKSNLYMDYLIKSYDTWIRKVTEHDNNLKHNQNFTPMGKLTVKDGVMPLLVPVVYIDKKIREGIDLNQTEEMERKELSLEYQESIIKNTYELVDRTIEHAINIVK
ncbi:MULTISPECIES: hypothetical protein [Bacteroides]|uniref:Uncharacterized protein n=1 Tax=Bacteroides fragilis TaxID=817 RepID=A0AAE6ESN3_BACFG|nr:MULTISPECIES: hypothetical protein [Bacteroides]MDK2382556.1 hypothetical protein [Bacteroides fragilis]QCQ44742.1 hypothetical protein EC80_007750 [Bacteroides fragilis]QLK82132.1 hypothetical protein DBK98_008215 [Bacteroides sp. PHL 2737]